MTGSSRITIDPNICGGRPCIRGLRVRVTDILSMLAAGARSLYGVIGKGSTPDRVRDLLG